MKSKKLRDSARGQECQFKILGVCIDSEDSQHETTVLCHLPHNSHGMGLKATDFATAYGCMACHRVVDGLAYSDEYEQFSDTYNFNAMVATNEIFYQQGLITVKGAK